MVTGLGLAVEMCERAGDPRRRLGGCGLGEGLREPDGDAGSEFDGVAMPLGPPS